MRRNQCRGLEKARLAGIRRRRRRVRGIGLVRARVAIGQDFERIGLGFVKCVPDGKVFLEENIVGFERGLHQVGSTLRDFQRKGLANHLEVPNRVLRVQLKVDV